MGRGGPFRWGLTLAVVLVAQHTLAAEDVCRTGCRGAPQNFKYAVGTTYKYNYEGKIDIDLSTAEGQVTSTEVKAVVLLTQQADCNQVLRLQNVQILGSNGKKYGSIPDVEKPIRLNNNDGRLEDSICVEPGDTQNSINIKRAIASLFQANLKNNYETDVFGLCLTETAQHKEGNVLVIQKSKNLNKCSYREHLKQDFFATAFNLNSEIKSSPVLDAEYNAKLRVKNGILDQANVIENYLYTPFSVGRNGAKAQVVSKLQYAGTSKDNPNTKCSQPRSIIFENPHPVVAPGSNVNTITNGVKEVLKTINVVVGDNTAKEYITLIKTARASKKDDLLAAYNQVKSGAGFSDKTAAKKIFLDALLQAGTGDTIEVAITLLKSNELNEAEKILVYFGISLVSHVTESSINTAATLLNQRNLPYEAYLGLGNLVGRYCQQHSCKNVDAIAKLTQQLIRKLGDGKAANKAEENDIIYVLKAFGNFQYISDNIVQKIIAIAQDKKAPNRLRVAALETYLADPCKDKLRDNALSILQDIQQDSEVRIKAYLVVAQCPNAKIGNAVKALLEKEPSYQVGGFIVSHIRNIKASANPDKDLAKQYLGFSVPKKFPIDFRKWSYNAEFSYAVDTLGVAASSEANIIYSQDSFLPRSSSLNLTADIFGHTFNFLEIKTRQENLDRLIEHYFGPKGLIRTTSLGELLKNGGQTASKAWDYLKKSLSDTIRSRRDVSRSEIESIGKAVQIKENELNKDLDLDLSVKAFGSEILFTNFNVYQKGLTPEAVIDKIVASFGKGLDRLKQFDEVFRSNILFLDVEFAYPTGLGFPLRLAVEGISNIQVKAKGALDVRAVLSGKDSNVKVQLIPSANIEIGGRLTLDALVVENGLKVSSNLYTSTGGDITINLFDHQKGIDIKFGLPVQQQKLVSATHEIVFHTREQTGHETNAPLKFAQNKDFELCLDQLSPYIGLGFCVELNSPNVVGDNVPVLPFPLSGDGKVEVIVTNEDVLEYHIKTTPKQLLIETIGKNRQRKLGFQVDTEVAGPEKYIKATFTSIIKTGSAELRLTQTKQEISLLGRAILDKAEYYAKIGIASNTNSQRGVYKPIFETKLPDGSKAAFEVQGQVVVEYKQPYKYTLDQIKIVLSNGDYYKLNGYFTGEPSWDLTLSNKENNQATFKGLIVSGPPCKVNVEFQNNYNPKVNFHISGDYNSKQNEEYESSLQLIHGPDLSSKTNRIYISNSVIKRYKSNSDFIFGAKNKFTYPLIGLSNEIEFKQTSNSIEYDVDVEYKDVKFGSELDIKINSKQQGDFEVEFEIYGLDNKVEFKAQRQVQGEESKISNELEVNGKRLEVKGKVRHHVKPSNIDVGADLTVILPTHNTPFKVISGVKYTPNEIDAQHKVTSGSTIIVDAFLKATKGGNANGSIKVNIKNLLVVNGQLKSNKGTGNGDILIDAQSLKQQVKLDTTFQIQPPNTYNIDLTFYPIFNQDKSQKVIFSTHNKLSLTNADSRNKLQILDKNFEVNIKGSRSGDEQNGKSNGEVEITLPNDEYLLGKINVDVRKANDLLNGQSLASLEYRKNKNAAGQKVSLKSVYKNTDPTEGLYDVEFNIAADDSNGKNINADVGFKSSKQGTVRNLDIKNKIYGSIIQHPLELGVTAGYKEGEGNYKARASYGPSTALQVSASYELQVDSKPLSGAFELQLNAPGKGLKTLNVKTTGSIYRPQNPSEQLKLEGSAKIYAEDGATSGPILDLSGDGSVTLGDKEGVVKGSAKLGKIDPISALTSYRINESGKQKQFNGNVAVEYGKGQNFKIDGLLVKTGEHQYKLEAEINAPTEEYKNTKLVLQTKRSEDGSHVSSDIQITSDGKTWTLDTELIASELTPLVNVQLKCPQGEVSQIYLKGNKVSDREFGGEVKIIYKSKKFLLEGNFDANVENIEQFFIKGNVNSPNLNLEKVTFEVHNKPGKTGRRIQVAVKSASKNLLSGSTSYQTREEQGKYVVEGAGSFKVKDETKSANFKYISQRLTQAKNKEEGIQITFDGGIGSRAIDAELKVTNKQFTIQSSYCEAKKECAHVEIDSKTNTNEVDAFNQELEVSIDLRKLGLSHEFGLKAVTNRKEYEIDHTVDIHFQSQENSKYQYSFYVQPRKAGATLTTPKRVVALEANANIPANIKQGGKVSGEIAFYLDKRNQPNQKASLSGWLNIDIQGKSINGETVLTHPGLPRPLTASIKTSRTGTPTNGEATVVGILDIFVQPGQKIVATYKAIGSSSSKTAGAAAFKYLASVQSSGLGIDISASNEISVDRQTYSGGYSSSLRYRVGNSNYDNAFEIKGGKTQFNFLLRIFNVNVLKANNRLNLNREEQIIASEVSSYDSNPLVSLLEIKNFNTLKYVIGFKNTPRDKIQFNSALIPGQIADLRADHLTGGKKYNLFQATLKLDDANFFKPDYSVNSKEVETVLDYVKECFANYVNGLQNIGKEWSNDIRKEVSQLGQISSQASPNLQPLKNYYAGELEKIKNEILSDKSVQELGELLKKVFGAVAQSIGGIFAKISELVESVVKSIQLAFTSVIESIDKELIPQLRDLADKITGVALDLAKRAVDIAAGYLALVSQLIEKYQPEIKQLAATFGELGQDVARFIQKAYEQVRIIAIEQWKIIYNELKALPLFEDLKERYKEFVENVLPNAEVIIGGIREISDTIKDVLPAELIVRDEIINIVDVIVQYIEKKLTNQPVDDFGVLERLIGLNAALIKKAISGISAPSYDVQNAEVPVSLDFLKKLPKLVAVKFSPIGYLIREDTTDELVAFLLSLLNNPRQWFAPFPLYSMVVQGQHIFTFDGKHLTFPGNCKYLLARDAVNGNFTIVGTYSNGLLSAITLADKQDTITIKKGGQILVNNAPSELPARKPEISAFRGYNVIILKSTAGVTIHCTPDLVGCSVAISGFYHGQLKGLLGNGNNEPYDDFTVANGKIVQNENEFGNSYKIGNCQPVNVPHQHGEINPTCAKLFDWESPLRYCYPFVNTENFKTACSHGLAAGVKDTEQAIAAAYVAACNQHNIPISLPSNLVACTNGDKSYSVGDKFSVKVPAKAADIVLIVDTVKSNEPVYKDLIQPLIQEVTKELNSKGINDVEIHLIAYGGENQWPSHVTVDGKLTFKGKSPNLKFGGPNEEEPLVDQKYIPDDLKRFVDVIETVVHDLKLALGLNLEAQTYTEALGYPFRAHAVKGVIVANSSPCETGKFLLLQKLRALLYRNNQISLNLITPFEHISLKDPKKTKDIVGFDDQKVFTISQAKKKPEGTAELYKELQYDDFCVDFAIKNRGNVFVSENFVNAKPDVRKQYIHSASHNIVNQLTNIEEGLDCECRMINPYNAQNVCREVYAKERAVPARKAGAKG